MAGQLGCGEYSVYFTARCGDPRVCGGENMSSLDWNRKLDNISDCTVVFPTGGQDCCECLGTSVYPFCTEIHVIRSGQEVWSGVVQDVTFTRNTATIFARDFLAWAGVRYLPDQVSYVGKPTDIVTIASDLLKIGLAEDDPCLLDYVTTFLPSLNPDIETIFEAYDGTVLDNIQTLAENGLDYTVLGRSILLFGDETESLNPIGVITDDLILGDVEVSYSGALIGNEFIVRYDKDDESATCVANGATKVPCPAIATEDDIRNATTGAYIPNVSCYGLIQRLRNDASQFSLTSAQQTAAGYLKAGTLNGRTLSFPSGARLAPETPWDINDMVPGQRVDASLRICGTGLYEAFRLQEVDVHVEAGNEEISCILAPLNSITATT